MKYPLFSSSDIELEVTMGGVVRCTMAQISTTTEVAIILNHMMSRLFGARRIKFLR